MPRSRSHSYSVTEGDTKSRCPYLGKRRNAPVLHSAIIRLITEIFGFSIFKVRAISFCIQGFAALLIKCGPQGISIRRERIVVQGGTSKSHHTVTRSVPQGACLFCVFPSAGGGGFISFKLLFCNVVLRVVDCEFTQLNSRIFFIWINEFRTRL